MFPKMNRNEYAPLFVQVALDRGRYIQTSQPNDIGIELRHLGDPRFEGFPRLKRKYVDARVEKRGRENQSRFSRTHRVPKARRQTRAPFGVDRMRKLPSEHDCHHLWAKWGV